MLYFERFKVKKGILVSDISNINGADIVPVGLILPYAKNTPPSGWLMCDGSSTSSYPELAVVVGSNIPNLNSSIVVGAGSGVGNGSSGNGVITGSSIPSGAVGTSPSSTNVNPMVNFTHAHTMASHTHPMSHTHNYPHTHSYLHYHPDTHTHTSQEQDSVRHTHRAYFANQIAPGTAAKAANGITPATAFATTSSGGHTHGNSTSLSPTIGAASGPWNGSGTVSSFIATGTTNSAQNNDTTASFGSASSPSGQFPIVQPIIGVYYIIKY